MFLHQRCKTARAPNNGNFGNADFKILGNELFSELQIKENFGNADFKMLGNALFIEYIARPRIAQVQCGESEGRCSTTQGGVDVLLERRESTLVQRLTDVFKRSP